MKIIAIALLCSGLGFADILPFQFYDPPANLFPELGIEFGLLFDYSGDQNLQPSITPTFSFGEIVQPTPVIVPPVTPPIAPIPVSQTPEPRFVGLMLIAGMWIAAHCKQCTWEKKQ